MSTDAGTKVTGLAGEVRCGGRVAARLSGWQLVGQASGWRLVGTVKAIDPYWLDQATRGGPAVTLVVPVAGGRRWRWHGVRVVRWTPSASRPGPDDPAGTGTIEIAGQGEPEVW